MNWKRFKNMPNRRLMGNWCFEKKKWLRSDQGTNTLSYRVAVRYLKRVNFQIEVGQLPGIRSCLLRLLYGFQLKWHHHKGKMMPRWLFLTVICRWWSRANWGNGKVGYRILAGNIILLTNTTRTCTLERAREPAPVFLLYVNENLNMFRANHFAVAQKRTGAAVHKTLVRDVTEDESLWNGIGTLRSLSLRICLFWWPRPAVKYGHHGRPMTRNSVVKPEAS